MRVLRALGVAGVLALGVAAFTPLANVLNGWMAGTPRLEPAEAIVVLARGGVDADGVLTNASLRRTLLGVDLYRKGLAPLLVFSGGVQGGQGEAVMRAGLARGLGVPDAAILTPFASTVRTTRGEGAAMRQILAPRGIRSILLVADPVDMPRTRAVFERAGFTVLPAPTASSGSSDPESRLNLLRDIATEVVGLAYYRLSGHL
ncbi:MAG TPA: YdcF family protein [Candidatus Binatia bacterium]|nr:YdcF family protein [Candidatus Binatia bacterium]